MKALVRWKGYDHHGDTWEPEEHVVPKAKITNYFLWRMRARR